MSNTLSWRYLTDINETRTLFAKEVLPYAVEVYLCSCSHQEVIIKSDYQDRDTYICESCENDKFLDANHFLGNTAWYEPIEDIFSSDLLQSLNNNINILKEENQFLATVTLDIPNKIDLSCDEISFLQKNIFQISIDSHGNIDETLFANFKLDQFKYDNWFDFDDYSTQEDITSNHPILSNYKKRILSEIIKNRYFNFSDNIVKNIETLEQVSFFAYSKHLKEFDFYYWEKIGFLPSNQNLTINDALRYVANSRKEKSLKKAIFENYQEQMIDKSYYFLYPYCITKYIKDINIANRLIDLDLNMYFKEIVNHNSLELFLIYLVKHYSDKQIENLFKSYKKQEMFWFLDTVELFAELSDEMRNNFVKVSCKYNILHDEIITYHRLAMHERLLDTSFNYTQKQLDAIKFIEPYDIRLPQHGLELYNWSTALSNCLAGYSNLIKKYQTIIYGFCKNDEISFAVEIKDNKIIQAKSKYNNDLSKEDMDIVIHWYKEFILKEDKEL